MNGSRESTRGFPVAPDLLFVPIRQTRLAEHDLLNARLFHGHAFDPIGGNSALDQGMLQQNAQSFRRTSGVQVLSAFQFAEVGQ
jgi:hypothetical protein